MNNKDLLSKILPLAGGLGVGLLAAQYILPQTAKFVPNPYYKINTKGGLLIMPGDLAAEAQVTSIDFSAVIDGQVVTAEVTPADTIKLDFQWTETVQDIELRYKNNEGEVVGEHVARLGDGIITEEIILPGQDDAPTLMETDE